MPIAIINIAQMREWEQRTWATGQSEAEVIRRVGEAVARRGAELTRPEDFILILAGRGNNGADARQARPHLGSRRVELLDLMDPAADLAKLEAHLDARPSLVIDGLFGIGLNRPLDADWIRLVQRLNDSRVPVLSVDVPSGLNADTGQPQGAAVAAAATLCVGAPKIGLVQEPAWPWVGRLEVLTEVGLAGSPPGGDLQWTLAGDFADFPPRRAAASHKGTHGHLAIVAGSLGYHGAAVLAARGALRAQPGLITLHTMEQVYHPIASQLQAVMVSPWTPGGKLPGPWTAILIGPGLAADEVPDEVKMLARHLWRDALMPVVVDASALDWLSMEPVSKNVIRVVTPHPGEAARLLRYTPQQVQANRYHALRALSGRLGGCWVVLKGHQTLVGRGVGPVRVNPSGNPHLGQGGSGDVLAGYLAGLLAQPGLRADVLQTLAYGVWQHGAAADALASTRRNWVVEEMFAEMGNQVG